MIIACNVWVYGTHWTITWKNGNLDLDLRFLFYFFIWAFYLIAYGACVRHWLPVIKQLHLNPFYKCMYICLRLFYSSISIQHFQRSIIPHMFPFLNFRVLVICVGHSNQLKENKQNFGDVFLSFSTSNWVNLV